MSSAYRVVVSEYATGRLREVFEYERRKNGLRYALQVASLIREHMNALRTFPEGHPKVEGHGAKYEIRYRRVESYKIMFRVRSDEPVVDILTVRNDAESPDVVLGDL